MSDNSIFDPAMLMDQQFADANSTVRLPIPEGEFPAVIKETKLRVVNSKDQTKTYLFLEVTWDLDSQELKDQLDRTDVTCRQSIILDCTSDGRIDMGKGKNIGLGRLREALGMNVPGQPFSFSMLAGAGPAKVSVKHRAAENDPEIVYDEVRGVAKLD